MYNLCIIIKWTEVCPMAIELTIRKWGNSFGAVIPIEVVEKENLKENSKIKIELVKEANLKQKCQGKNLKIWLEKDGLNIFF